MLLWQRALLHLCSGDDGSGSEAGDDTPERDAPDGIPEQQPASDDNDSSIDAEVCVSRLCGAALPDNSEGPFTVCLCRHLVGLSDQMHELMYGCLCSWQTSWKSWSPAAF